MSETSTNLFLVTGGAGFIGSYVAKCLHSHGIVVRIADIAPAPLHLGDSQYFCGNLCDPTFCELITKGVHTVIHLAANMGGMGTIHGGDDFIIYHENHTMTTNILRAAVKAGTHCFLFASSACVYPAHLQMTSERAVRLKESDVWANPPPTPQGLYGLEKLAGELLLHQFAGKLEIKIARFHNIYGPGGTWNGGREKAPAAFARKAVAAQLSSSELPTFEIWGDGSQRRSFLYIDDAVEAIRRLLKTDGAQTVNIGSEDEITMQDLASFALLSAGVDPAKVRFEYDLSKPIGVASRNADIEIAQKELAGWRPTVCMEEGMRRTTEWIEAQIKNKMSSLDQLHRASFLEGLRRSAVVHLQAEEIVFALLLPITSRGMKEPQVALENLENFAESLARTTREDANSVGDKKFRIIIYIAVDNDDEFLLQRQKPEAVLRTAGFLDVRRIVCNYPKGHVCSLWRDCAKRAWEDESHYFMLVGDDVEFLDGQWLHDVDMAFVNLAKINKGPHGLGCVALTDITFPGMPTFPVVHRTHLDIFHGEVVPDCFINQDGDPFLFQLYRRFGSSVMIPARIRNRVGGSETARYLKQHAEGWTHCPLRDATTTVSKWLDANDYSVENKLTLDVVIPSYRVQMAFLRPMLELKCSPSCCVMWIIIVDDPESPAIAELEREYGARVDIRIRINPKNLGASESRNRGMVESAAEWVHFLDDDVTPHPDLLFEAERAIRAHPGAAGFVGNAQFPVADTIFKTAVHLAGVTYFWDIATKIQEDVPWGVTANLIVRRDIQDDIRFDPRFPKTGGGEDIDLCVRKRDWFVANNMEGFRAAPKAIVTHPWWNNGSRTYWRFYMWGKGDGALVHMFPQHCFLDPSPNSAELILYSSILSLVAIVAYLWRLALLGFLGVIVVFITNIVHDLSHYLGGLKGKESRSTLWGIGWYLAVMEGAFIRIASEGGRLVGQLERGEFRFFRPRPRFDWFVGRAGPGPAENERANSRQRLTIWSFLMVIIWILLDLY